ncbi:hypothetical protein [Desulforegula conservatrix]|uniref:hypothetical protein n=1 Tax=Desulforegula conservatrix TaxID=153026 RepID=UPI00047F2EE8|nr:hypothetical protein [Desulforegula conservatrix]
MAVQFFQTSSEFFKQNCPKAVDTIYEKAYDVKSIFFDNGVTHDSGIGSPDGYINSGLLEFYEIRNNKDTGKPYLRYRFGDKKGREVDELESQYSVIQQDLAQHLREELAIHGATIFIIENKSKKVLATKTYIQSHSRNDTNDRRCGSYSRFLFDVLNLTKRFPSFYDKK